MVVVVYQRKDGGLSVLQPADNVYISGSGPQAKFKTFLDSKPEKGFRLATVREIAERDVPAGLSWKIIDDSGLPDDRYFRSAWKHDDGIVSIDMDKARNIHMDKIRKARDAALEVLDVETLKGIDVQKEKQVLRDLPQTVDLTKADTPDELRAIWPEEIKDSAADIVSLNLSENMIS